MLLNTCLANTVAFSNLNKDLNTSLLFEILKFLCYVPKVLFKYRQVKLQIKVCTKKKGLWFLLCRSYMYYKYIQMA